MNPNTVPQKSSAPERKLCSKCYILMGTHEQGMVTIPAVTAEDGAVVTPEKYYHKGHEPKIMVPASEKETTASIPAALHDPVITQSTSVPIQA